jgi:hypothetical protein
MKVFNVICNLMFLEDLWAYVYQTPTSSYNYLPDHATTVAYIMS